MNTVIVLLEDVEIRVFSSLDRMHTYLINSGNGFSEDDWLVLLAEHEVSTGYGVYCWDEHQVDAH